MVSETLINVSVPFKVAMRSLSAPQAMEEDESVPTK